MKRISLTFSLVLIVFSLSTNAQSFTKRKYSKGFFHEKIKKPKEPAGNKVFEFKRSARPVLETELNEVETVVVTKVINAEDTISKPLTVPCSNSVCSNVVKKQTSTAVHKTKKPEIKSIVLASDEPKTQRFFHCHVTKKMQFGCKQENKTEVILSQSKSDESLWSYLFGSFFESFLDAAIVLVVLSILVSIIILLLTFCPLVFCVTLGVILLIIGVYFAIDFYSQKHSGKGEKIADALYAIGGPVFDAIYEWFNS